MSEERRRILDMLAEGKLSVDEAERLLAAIEAPAASSGADAGASGRKGKLKYLRVVVEPREQEGASGGEHVNVRVPLQLLRSGVKLAAIMPESARIKLDGAFEKQGLKLDLNNLAPGAVDELIEHFGELSVDVGNDKERVRVFCE